MNGSELNTGQNKSANEITRNKKIRLKIIMICFCED